MTQLANARHEAFVQAYIVNKNNATEAYKATHAKCKSDKAARACASRLLTIANVAARIAELQEAGAERAVVTLESLISEAADIQRKAIEAGQYSAAVAALTAKAKLAGFWVDRSENKNENTHYAISDEPMSAEEWAKQYVRQ